MAKYRQKGNVMHIGKPAKTVPCVQCPEHVKVPGAHTHEVGFGKVLDFCSADCKRAHLHDVH